MAQKLNDFSNHKLKSVKLDFTFFKKNDRERESDKESDIQANIITK